MKRIGWLVLATLLVAGGVLLPGPSQAATTGKDRFKPLQRSYWAFQKVVRPAVPATKQSSWVRNPIDAFVLAKLEAKAIVPGVEADKVTLLRRVTLDLIGLPPTPEETDAFLADKSPEAYTKVVDRLLAS